MIPENPIETMHVYASESQYLKGPDPAAQVAGTVPLDTLPADWWNWLWQEITKRINEASTAVESIHNEILSVLQAASITPSEVSTTDLLNAIKAITRTVGSGDTAGAVKSSTKSGYVAIDSSGYMSPNGMGIPMSLNTTAKQIVGAINEVLASLNTYKTSTNDSITGLTNSKAPTNHASSATTYGTGSSTNYGHVKLSDATNGTEGEGSGVAATPAAVATVQAAVDDLNIVLALPVGVTVPYAGATAPTGWLLCNGQAVSRTSYSRLFAAIGTTYGQGDGSTTFNVPDLRECNPVGIGKRASGVTNHNELTLGGFQDDQYQQHFHRIGGSTGATQPTFTGTAHNHSFTPEGTVSSHSHGLNSRTHSFIPKGEVSSHTHSFTPEGTVSRHHHNFKWTGSHSHDTLGISGRSETDEGFGGGIDCNRWYGSNKVGTSSTSITVEGDTTSTLPSFTGILGITKSTQPTFTGTAGTTGLASGNTTSTTPTFTGTRGTTGSTTASGSVSSHSHSLPSRTIETGASTGGTHGKLLGMNYIIKT